MLVEYAQFNFFITIFSILFYLFIYLFIYFSEFLFNESCIGSCILSFQ